MKRRFHCVASVSLSLAFLSWPATGLNAVNDAGKNTASASSAAEQYQALAKEFGNAQQEYFKAYQQAKTDEERRKVSQSYPRPQQYTARFLELAEKHPDAVAAIDALVWVVQQGRQGEDVEKALGILQQKHLDSEKLGPVCQSLVYSQFESAEKFLREVAAKNTHRAVQGQASFSLAQFLKNQQRRVGSRQTPSEEAEKLFEQVAETYGDLPHYRGKLGEAAKAALFEIRNLAIGQVAPEIEGKDVDGNRFKLSEYRGKVVVIDFWGDW